MLLTKSIYELQVIYIGEMMMIVYIQLRLYARAVQSLSPYIPLYKEATSSGFM